jgi:hypothetical protein
VESCPSSTFDLLLATNTPQELNITESPNMGIRLDSPEEIVTIPPIDSIPDGPEDKPTPGPLLVCGVSNDQTIAGTVGD